MDIQVASNFERFLYYAVARDSRRVREIMADFKTQGEYRFQSFDRSAFTTSRAVDEEIEGIIGDVYQRYGVIIDPHTACGFKDLDATKVSVTLATAHPAKFPETIVKAIGKTPSAESLEGLKSRKIIKYHVAANKLAIQDFISRHACL